MENPSVNLSAKSFKPFEGLKLIGKPRWGWNYENHIEIHSVALMRLTRPFRPQLKVIDQTTLKDSETHNEHCTKDNNFPADPNFLCHYWYYALIAASAYWDYTVLVCSLHPNVVGSRFFLKPEEEEEGLIEGTTFEQLSQFGSGVNEIVEVENKRANWRFSPRGSVASLVSEHTGGS